jgi:hypothetical protein
MGNGRNQFPLLFANLEHLHHEWDGIVLLGPLSNSFSGGGDVMVRQIEELLLLTCLGGFIAGITYAVTLLR